MDDLDNAAQLQRKLAAIRESFLQRTRGELPFLLQLLERVQAGNLASLLPLQIFAHRIRGSGATFDFAAISESAGHIENLLEELGGAATDAAVDLNDLDRLLESGRRLALEIGAASTQESPVER